MKGHHHVRQSLARRALGIGLALAASVPMVLSAAAPAQASPTDVLTLAGSDTTELVMKAVFNCGANSLCTNTPGGSQNGVAQPALTNPVYNLFFSTNQTTAAVVPADPNCQGAGAVTYHSPALPGEFVPPAGSGAGRTALDNSVAKSYPDAAHNSTDVGAFGGCIDIARSSGLGGASTKREYYAFGLDAVGVASPSLLAPASLTLQQVRDIYSCQVNDWSQVGGRPGKILRQVPQSGSGTGDFFMSNVLGLGSTTRPSVTNFPETGPSGACPTPVYTEENNGVPLGGRSNSDPVLSKGYQNYIEVYSSGKWVFQANNPSNPTQDLRSGARPIAMINDSATTGIAGASPVAPVRWIGSEWRLNDATIVLGGKYNQRTTVAVTPSGSTITGPASTFNQNDVGKTVVNNGGTTFIPANTVITAVNGGGDTATLNNATVAGGPGAVDVYDVNRTASATASGVAPRTTLTAPIGTFRARDIGLYVQGEYINDGTVITAVAPDGSSATISPGTKSATVYANENAGTYPATKPINIGWSVISDKNPHVLTSSNVQYPGARYVYNVLHTDSPNYLEARTLVGFDDTLTHGYLSTLCNGDQEGVINSNGFLALPLLDRDGAGVGNDDPRSCVFRKV
jgi:hypothetical protein